MSATLDDLLVELKNMRRELTTIRQLTGQAVSYIRDAEAEVPEKIRRFMNYMHDLHDIKYMYEELGHTAPQHQLREMERCDDRFRQLVSEQNAEGGTFSKVRRDMAADPMNRWDHTRQLAAPTHLKETADETGQSQPLGNGLDKDGAGVAGGAPGVSGADGE